MIIDIEIDKHIIQVEKELEHYDILEFKNMISSIFMNTILPSKEDLKILSLIFRICIDFIKDNKDNIRSLNVDKVVDFINTNVYNAEVLSFRVVDNVKSGCIGFKIITNLKYDTNTYCLNEKLCINDIKYYTIDEIISKMFIISMDVE